MADLDLTTATAAETAALIGDETVSAAECLDFWLDRAGADDLNGYLWKADREAASEGVKADSGSPVAGVPVAIKDIFCTTGVPTTAASRILEGYRPPYSATAVRRLAEAGMPMLGKTNMDEFAMG
ncbi:MAG: amidase family protein, partial [Actinomycetota bacterium]|nr:amidase family protein [Actinomycetota bacterium]